MINTTTGIVNNKVNEVLLIYDYIDFIYPTREIVTNDGNKLKYYCNQLSSIRIHFNNLYNSFDFICGLRKSCLLFWFVRSEIALNTCTNIQEDINFLRTLPQDFY